MDKKKLYEKFGAVWFQKVVFKVEDLKFKLIDKFCPNIGEWYSKKCDCKVRKLCSKTFDEEKRKEIRREYNYRKMRFKRELVEKKNRNYHMTLNNANSFYDYLLWNKKIHMHGIIKNLVCIGGYSILLNYLSGFWFGIVLADLVFNILSLGVNFQCVNLQNYNICRFKEKEDVLIRLEERKKAKDVRNYSLVGEKIYNQLEKSVECPKGSDIVDLLNSQEELEQLRKLALEIKRQRSKEGSSYNKEKVYVKK